MNRKHLVQLVLVFFIGMNVISQTVTYHANGAVIGTVPIDTYQYPLGTSLTALSNTGYLAKVGYSLAGWNTAEDGNGITVCSGGTLEVSSIPINLYAIWIPTSFGYRYGGNSIEITESNPVQGVLRIPGGVTSIGNWAFKGMEGITSVIIPDSVNQIGVQAFWGNTKLREVTLPRNLIRISAGLFFRSTNLRNIELPRFLESIESQAFLKSGITKVRIPKTVINIDDRAFSECPNLLAVYFFSPVPPLLGNQVFGESVSSRFKIYVPKENYARYCASWPELASFITTF